MVEAGGEGFFEFVKSFVSGVGVGENFVDFLLDRGYGVPFEGCELFLVVADIRFQAGELLLRYFHGRGLCRVARRDGAVCFAYLRASILD